METVHLSGAEDVRRAGVNMASAAEEISRTVGFLGEYVGQLQRALDDHATRIEQALREAGLDERSDRAAERAMRAFLDAPIAGSHHFAMPLDEWHDDDGPVLWWKFPIAEPPYAGTPNDSDWPGYHTHWTRIDLPEGPK